MTKKSIIVWILILTIADQAIKLIIANYFFDVKFDLIENYIGFRPIYNNQYSYFNGLFGLNIGLLPHALFLIPFQLGILIAYGYYKKAQPPSKLLDISFIFGQASVLCVFFGFFFWDDGILDFLFLYFFTCDLKDIYLNLFTLFLSLNIFVHYKDIRRSNLKMTSFLKSIFPWSS